MRRFPARVAASRAGNFAMHEVFTYGFTGHDRLMDTLAKVADRFRRKELEPTPSCSPRRRRTTRWAASAS